MLNAEKQQNSVVNGVRPLALVTVIGILITIALADCWQKV